MAANEPEASAASVTLQDLVQAADLTRRTANVQGENRLLTPPMRGGIAVPTVSALQVAAVNNYGPGTDVVLTWLDVVDPDVDSYVVYVKGLASTGQNLVRVGAAQMSPARVSLVTQVTRIVTLFVQTVMKSGAVSDLSMTPSATATIQPMGP